MGDITDKEKEALAAREGSRIVRDRITESLPPGVQDDVKGADATFRNPVIGTQEEGVKKLEGDEKADILKKAGLEGSGREVYAKKGEPVTVDGVTTTTTEYVISMDPGTIRGTVLPDAVIREQEVKDKDGKVSKTSVSDVIDEKTGTKTQHITAVDKDGKKTDLEVVGHRDKKNLKDSFVKITSKETGSSEEIPYDGLVSAGKAAKNKKTPDKEPETKEPEPEQKKISADLGEPDGPAKPPKTNDRVDKGSLGDPEPKSPTKPGRIDDDLARRKPDSINEAPAKPTQIDYDLARRKPDSINEAPAKPTQIDYDLARRKDPNDPTEKTMERKDFNEIKKALESPQMAELLPNKFKKEIGGDMAKAMEAVDKLDLGSLKRNVGVDKVADAGLGQLSAPAVDGGKSAGKGIA